METIILALDNGNFELKYFQSHDQQPQAIRSAKYQIPNGRNPLQASTSSPVVEHKGIKYHFGYKAFSYRQTISQETSDKVDDILLNTLAVLDPPSEEFRCKVYTSHYYLDSADKIRRSLIGKHQYTRNGKQATVWIDSVEVVQEAIAAWSYAKSLRVIPTKGYTIVVDIGGGSWISRLISSDGEIIDSTVSERGGAYDLALNISLDNRLIKLLQDQPNPAVVMNGFCSDVHEYAQSGISWKPWLDEYLEPWFKGIFGKTKVQYKAYAPEIKCIFVTGGAAHLIRPKVQSAPLFAMTDEPRFDNVRGLTTISPSLLKV